MNDTEEWAFDIYALFDIFVPLSRLEWAVTLTLFPFLVLLYITVIFKIYTDKSDDYRKNPFYTLICATAICDFGMHIYTVYSIVLDTVKYRFLGQKFDSLMAYVFYWALGWYGTQIFNVLVAFNRFYAFIFNSHYSSFFTKTKARVLSLIGIIVSLLIPLPVHIHTSFKYVSMFKVGQRFIYFYISLKTCSYIIILFCYFFLSFFLSLFLSFFLSFLSFVYRQIDPILFLGISVGRIKQTGILLSRIRLVFLLCGWSFIVGRIFFNHCISCDRTEKVKCSSRSVV